MGTAVGAGVRGMWPGWGAQNHFNADEVIVQSQGLTLGVGDRSDQNSAFWRQREGRPAPGGLHVQV